MLPATATYTSTGLSNIRIKMPEKIECLDDIEPCFLLKHGLQNYNGKRNLYARYTFETFFHLGYDPQSWVKKIIESNASGALCH